MAIKTISKKQSGKKAMLAEAPVLLMKKGGVKKMQAGGNTSVTIKTISPNDPYEVAKRKLQMQKEKIAATKKRDLAIAVAKRNRDQASNKNLKQKVQLTGKMAKGGSTDKNWIQKAINPAHKGYCTPMTKPTCTPKRKALAITLKKMAKNK
jgi:hypothetical protein